MSNALLDIFGIADVGDWGINVHLPEERIRLSSVLKFLLDHVI
jgi:hypothetical protein